MAPKRYDWSSGLVYEEKVVKTPKRHQDVQSFANKCLGRNPSQQSSAKGAHSLQKTAMQNLLCNLRSLEDSSLINVPVALLEQIWTAIRRSQLDSIRVWRIFAASALGNRSFVMSASTKHTPSRVEDLVNAARTPSFTWLTNLVVAIDGFKPSHLTPIASLDSLRRLHIVNFKSPRKPGTAFGDRTLRSWAEVAKTSGALSKLSTLFVYQCSEFTSHSLALLSSFPSLQEVCAYACGMTSPVNGRDRSFGWRKSQHGFYAHIQSSAAYFNHWGKAQPFWLSEVDEYFTALRSKSNDELDSRPLLTLQMTGCGGGFGGHFDIEKVICLERCPEPVSREPSQGHSVEDLLEGRPAKKARIPRKLMKFEDTFGVL